MDEADGSYATNQPIPPKRLFLCLAIAATGSSKQFIDDEEGILRREDWHCAFFRAVEVDFFMAC